MSKQTPEMKNAQTMIDTLIAATYRHAVAEAYGVMTNSKRDALRLRVVDAADKLKAHIRALEHPPMSFSDVRASHRKEFE